MKKNVVLAIEFSNLRLKMTVNYLNLSFQLPTLYNIELTGKLNGTAGEFVRRDVLDEMKRSIEKLTKDNLAFKKINEGTFS